MTEQPTLWEGVIPIVTDFDLTTVTGRALARNHEDGRARLILDVSREDAEMIKTFLAENTPICLSWITKPLPPKE